MCVYAHLASSETDDLATRDHRRFVWGMRKVYGGRDIEVSFDLDLCVHVAECLRGRREVFQLNRRPWILPDAAGADEVAEVVRRCPSGALLYHRLDGRPDEDPAGPAKATPIKNGPLLVAGKIEVRREDGTRENPPRSHPFPRGPFNPPPL